MRHCMCSISRMRLIQTPDVSDGTSYFCAAITAFFGGLMFIGSLSANVQIFHPFDISQACLFYIASITLLGRGSGSIALACIGAIIVLVGIGFAGFITTNLFMIHDRSSLFIPWIMAGTHGFLAISITIMLLCQSIHQYRTTKKSDHTV